MDETARSRDVFDGPLHQRRRAWRVITEVIVERLEAQGTLESAR